MGLGGMKWGILNGPISGVLNYNGCLNDLLFSLIFYFLKMSLQLTV